MEFSLESMEVSQIILKDWKEHNYQHRINNSMLIELTM